MFRADRDIPQMTLSKMWFYKVLNQEGEYIYVSKLSHFNLQKKHIFFHVTVISYFYVDLSPHPSLSKDFCL